VLWRRQAERRARAIHRAEDGLWLLRHIAAYLILTAARAGRRGRKASVLWLLAYFVVLTIAELYISPVSLSLVTKVAPARAVSMMMGVWLATSFVGNFLAGYLGSFWSDMAKDRFFSHDRQ